MRNPPAFQFYADDFLAGTLDLSQSEVGAYIRLLCHQWSRGSIPVETEKQQRLAGGSVSADVSAKFKLNQDGRLVNERLERERQKQSDYREMQRQKGILSAESRKNQPKTNRGSTEPPTAVQPNGQPEGSSPSPSPSPSELSLTSGSLDPAVEGSIPTDSSDTPSGDGSEGIQPPPQKPLVRERNKLLDALVAVDGSDPLKSTSPAFKAAAAALKTIREVSPDVTPEEITRRARIYRMNNKDWSITPTAIAKYWGSCDRLGAAKPKRTGIPNL